MLQKIKLLKPHNGRPRGAVVPVDDLRAERMIEDGIGKPVRAPKPKRKP